MNLPGVKFLWTTPQFGSDHARTVTKCTKKSAKHDKFVVLLSVVKYFESYF